MDENQFIAEAQRTAEASIILPSLFILCASAVKRLYSLQICIREDAPGQYCER
jgi:hypothetical protein